MWVIKISLYNSSVYSCHLSLISSALFSSVQSLSCVQLCNPMNHSTPGLPAYHQLSELVPIELVMPSSHLILCCPLLLLPPIPPKVGGQSGQSLGVSASTSVPPNEHPGLIFFRMAWLDLLAVQGALKSLLQQHSSKASILWCSVFFTIQLSHPYMTTGKNTALTRRTFVGKIMSLLFNMLSRLVITFLLRSKRLVMSWLQSPSAVILEPPKTKSDTASTVSPSISHEVLC